MPARDHHARSIIKGITWRIVGTADTALLSYLYTGQVGDALKIAAAELLTKILLFYLHERIWMRLAVGNRTTTLPDGRVAVQEAHWRSLVKGISWRLFGTLDTILWASVVTHNYTKAFQIGGTELITKVVLFYLHERVWMQIRWGSKLPDDLNAPLRQEA